MQKMTTVFYIGNHDPMLEPLRQYFTAQDIVLEPFSTTAPKVDYLLMIEPFKIGREFYSLSTTWKPWLIVNASDTRLMVAGYAESTHTSCLNLLDLPPDIKPWLEKVPPISSYRLITPAEEEEIQDLFDPWTIGLIKPGKEHNQMMRRFYLGHTSTSGEGSLISQIGMMKKLCGDMIMYEKKSMEEGQGAYWDKKLESKATALKVWKDFKYRLDFYLPFLKVLPDGLRKVLTLENISKELEDVLNSPTIPNLEHIKKQLKELLQDMKFKVRPFVFPEESWE